jgi:uncharacterized UPF0160 family protein
VNSKYSQVTPLSREAAQLELGKIKNIVTHSGVFHADDVMAIAMIALAQGQFVHADLDTVSRGIKVITNNGGVPISIVRDRAKVGEPGVYDLDCGGVYAPERNKFDHHQSSFKETWNDGTPLSTCGLIFNRFYVNLLEDEKLLNKIAALAKGVDARDNGINKTGYSITNCISSFLPVWSPEKDNTQKDMDNAFKQVLAWAIKFLVCFIEGDGERQLDLMGTVINQEVEKRMADERVENILEDMIAKLPENCPVLHMEKFIPWSKSDAIRNSPKTLKFVTYPSINDGEYIAQTISDWTKTEEGSMLASRLPFPEEWGGKEKTELALVSGIEDAWFCHKNCFLFIARSWNGANQAVAKALASEARVD